MQGRPFGRGPLRPRLTDSVFLALAVVAFASLLWLGRGLTFHSDEWSIIAVPRQPTLASWLEPHNEHWSTVLYAIHGALQALFGLRTYLPYLAALLALHVVTAAGLYALGGRVAPRWLALLGAAILLFLGSGYEDLFWAFQIGFLGSTATGIWALAVLAAGSTRSRNVAAATLLTLSVASSGIGLAFLAGAVVLTLVDPRARPSVPWLLLPVAAYGAWFALAGAAAVSVNADVTRLEAIEGTPWAVATGAVSAMAATFGLPPPLALAATLLLAGSVVAVGLRVLRGGNDEDRTRFALSLAAGAGVVVLFALIGLTRGQLGADAATRSRYVYPAATLILAATCAAIGRPAVPATLRPLAIGAVGVVAGIAIAANAQLLDAGSRTFQAYADQVRALTVLTSKYEQAPAVDPARALFPMPPPGPLLDLLAREGWPLGSIDLAVLPADAVDRALFQLVGPSFAVRTVPTAELPRSGTPPTVIAVSGANMTTSGACQTLGDVATTAHLDLAVPDGAMVDIVGPSSGTITAAIGRQAPPQPTTAQTLVLQESTAAGIAIPRLADGSTWRLGLDLAGPGRWQVCLEASAAG